MYRRTARSGRRKEPLPEHLQEMPGPGDSAAAREWAEARRRHRVAAGMPDAEAAGRWIGDVARWIARRREHGGGDPR
ncbi:hypothetical protein ACU61A_28530 [Pseudonocardia sichuanensis]